jgi:hypothetical protein
MILQWDESFDIASDTLTGVNDADYKPRQFQFRASERRDDDFDLVHRNQSCRVILVIGQSKFFVLFIGRLVTVRMKAITWMYSPEYSVHCGARHT